MIRTISWKQCIRPTLGVAALTALVGLLPAAAFADETDTASDQPATTNAATPAAETATIEATAIDTAAVDFSGMVVHIDPETGRLRPPTADEAQALSRALARRLAIQSTSAASRTEQHLANGAVMMELDPSYHEYTLVRRAPDGALVTDCVHGAETAVERAQKPVEAPAAPEVK